MSGYLVNVPHDGVVADDEGKMDVGFLVAGRTEWIPRSQLDEYDDDKMIVPRWLANDRGLDFEECEPKVCWRR